MGSARYGANSACNLSGKWREMVFGTDPGHKDNIFH